MRDGAKSDGAGLSKSVASEKALLQMGLGLLFAAVSDGFFDAWKDGWRWA
jgi:hypothetical protein